MENVRYRVVNEKKRTTYEKKHQKAFQYYDYIGPKIKVALKICRQKKDPNYIVERIYDTDIVKSLREEIFRSGEYYEENS